MAATSGFSQLSADLIKLYVSGEGADVTFVFPVDETQPAKRKKSSSSKRPSNAARKSEEEIRAHKAILCTRVPYFKTMFGSGMKEALTNSVNMPATDKESFDVFLRYIYGGQLPEDFDVEHQLNFAKMYDIPGLVTDCLPKLKEYLSKLPTFDDCIDESARMMAIYELEAAKSTFEQEMLRRIEEVAQSNVGASSAITPVGCRHCGRLSNPHSYCYCGRCTSCGVVWQNCQGRCKATPIPASFIDQLVKLLILSHKEKCATLKEKCLEHFDKIDKEGQHKTQMAEATKKLEPYPELLVEMVLRYRNR